MAQESYDLFISYPSKSALQYALDVHARLEAEGFRVWFDKRRLLPGCKWHEEIEAGCEASRIILPVLTPDWKASTWCRYETYGAEHVIPLLCEGEWNQVSTPPLQAFQFVDLRHAEEATWQRLLDAIRLYFQEHPQPPQKEPRLALLPLGHNPNFVGREELLLDLHERLHQSPTTALTQSRIQAVSGMGGVGKSTLAREYAEKFWRLYRHILWVHAEDRVLLVAELAQLALDLQLIRERKNDFDDARRLLRELNSTTPRLLILDNVADEQSIQDFLPTSGACRTILTSRFTGWSSAVEKIDVDTLQPAPACELLLRSSGRPATDPHRESAAHVANALGYLPLALEQAAAFVREAGLSFDKYLDYYSQLELRRDLLAHRVLGSTQYPQPVARTWLISIERVGRLALAVLNLSAFFAPDAIPRNLLHAATDDLETSLRSEDTDGAEQVVDSPRESGIHGVTPFALDNALRTLRRYSLITHLDEQSYAVHTLVQRVVADSLSEQEQRTWAKRALLAVSDEFPLAEFSNWQTCERLLPHALAMATLVERFESDANEATDLLNDVGFYLHCRGHYAAAESLYQRALRTRCKLGEQHLDYAVTLFNLAGLYCAQGKYAAAEQLYRSALEVFRISDEEYYAATLNALAWLYRSQGKYAAAEPLCHEALSIRRKAVGGEHADYAASLNNLAELYRAQGNYAAAEPLYQKALEIFRAAFGEEHPSYAESLSGLAGLYKDQGKYAAAEAIYQRALETDRKALGGEHPNYAANLNNLAALYRAQGNIAASRPLYERALEILRKALGEEHAFFATCLGNLAELYHIEGNYRAAQPLYERALAIRRTALGQEHPDYATSLDNLAELYRAQGNYAAAEPLYREALEVRRRALGDQHRDYAVSLNNLAELCEAEGNYATAEPLYQRSFGICRASLGPKHPLVAIVARNYARLLQHLDRGSEAAEYEALDAGIEGRQSKT